MGLHQTKKLLHNEGNHQRNEKATEWEKISTNQETARGIYPKYEKNSHNSKWKWKKKKD